MLQFAESPSYTVLSNIFPFFEVYAEPTVEFETCA